MTTTIHLETATHAMRAHILNAMRCRESVVWGEVVCKLAKARADAYGDIVFAETLKTVDRLDHKAAHIGTVHAIIRECALSGIGKWRNLPRLLATQCTHAPSMQWLLTHMHYGAGLASRFPSVFGTPLLRQCLEQFVADHRRYEMVGHTRDFVLRVKALVVDCGVACTVGDLQPLQHIAFANFCFAGQMLMTPAEPHRPAILRPMDLGTFVVLCAAHVMGPACCREWQLHTPLPPRPDITIVAQCIAQILAVTGASSGGCRGLGMVWSCRRLWPCDSHCCAVTIHRTLDALEQHQCPENVLNRLRHGLQTAMHDPSEEWGEPARQQWAHIPHYDCERACMADVAARQVKWMAAQWIADDGTCLPPDVVDNTMFTHHRSGFFFA